MITLIPFLAFCQALGAFVGALTALWSEIAYILAMRDKKIDSAERTHLRIIGRGLRFGMTLLLISSLALVIASYSLHGALQPAMTANYWILIVLALLTIGISWALARRNIHHTLGSAAAFTAWWFISYLTLGQLPGISFGTAIAIYLVLTAIIYVVFYCVRFFASRKK